MSTLPARDVRFASYVHAGAMQEQNADTFIAPTPPVSSTKAVNLDVQFFDENANSSLSSNAFTKGGGAFVRSRMMPHQNAVRDDGTPVSFRQARVASVLAANQGVGKKHHKKMKRVKQRSGKGYD